MTYGYPKYRKVVELPQIKKGKEGYAHMIHGMARTDGFLHVAVLQWRIRGATAHHLQVFANAGRDNAKEFQEGFRGYLMCAGYRATIKYRVQRGSPDGSM